MFGLGEQEFEKIRPRVLINFKHKLVSTENFPLRELDKEFGFQLVVSL